MKRYINNRYKSIKEIQMVHSAAQGTDTVMALDIAGDHERIPLQ